MFLLFVLKQLYEMDPESNRVRFYKELYQMLIMLFATSLHPIHREVVAHDKTIIWPFRIHDFGSSIGSQAPAGVVRRRPGLQTRDGA